MAQIEALHEKESIWQVVKAHYEEVMATNTRRIANLKTTLEDLQRRWECFATQLVKGWVGWATQAVELHAYRADWESRQRRGRVFIKKAKNSSLQCAMTIRRITKRWLIVTPKEWHSYWKTLVKVKKKCSASCATSEVNIKGWKR